ncbi:hypothetical protein JD844_028278 [Phrynosoma platyrhinos]|uniref:Ran-GTPase activating protein 1 C-terminal domain-containing protein n=1 Tax=Phrynosoma platyrhinos TaxID=52577 RepID=A0ABQ7SHP0_PHRPL|nr:hypothetical protein JD844_028278 [Phrynosoma platyrhinos]
MSSYIDAISPTPTPGEIARAWLDQGYFSAGNSKGWHSPEMASEDITKLAESLAKTQVGDGQLSFKGKSLKLNTAEDDALISAGCQLTELDLSDNAFGPDGVRGFEALLKSPSCFTLQELKLNNCGMGIGGGKILAGALTECHRKSSAQGKPLALKIFVAGRNRLENDGATALAEAFRVIGTLEEVHMPQNGINHPGITALAKAFAVNPLLRTLKKLRQVEIINFGDCLVRSKGAVAIAEAVSEGLHKLKELNLSFGEIKRDAALIIAEAIEDKSELEKLDLNGNCFGVEGCEQLQEILEGFNMAEVLASLSDDDGENEDDEEEEDEEEEDEEEEDEEEEEPQVQERGQGEQESLTPQKIITAHDTPPVSSPPPPPVDVGTFLAFPSPEKLLRLGPKCSTLIAQQTDTSDTEKVVMVFLKISSVFKDEITVKTAVNETTDALMRDAFSSATFNSDAFITSLLIHMGLLKIGHGSSYVVPKKQRNEKTCLHGSHYIYCSCLERPNRALDSCSFARHMLLQTLHQL